MHDPGPQLRAYLDQAVERVDVEDVFARARVRKHRARTSLIHARPAWIATAAALIMVISIGAVAAGAWLLRGDPAGDFATRTPSGSPVTSEWPGVLVLGLAIGGGSIGLLAGGTAVSNLIHRTRNRRTTMQTIETPELERTRLREETARLGSTKRILIVTLVVVLIAAVGAAAWLIIDNAGTAAERDIAALVDDWYAAYTNADGEGALSLMTADARYVGGRSGLDGWAGEEIKTGIERFGGSPNDQARVGGLLIAPRPQAYYVVARFTYSPLANEKIAMFHIVDENGTLKIRFLEEWQPMGWFRLADDLPYQPFDAGQ